MDDNETTTTEMRQNTTHKTLSKIRSREKKENDENIELGNLHLHEQDSSGDQEWRIAVLHPSAAGNSKRGTNDLSDPVVPIPDPNLSGDLHWEKSSAPRTVETGPSAAAEFRIIFRLTTKTAG